MPEWTPLKVLRTPIRIEVLDAIKKLGDRAEGVLIQRDGKRYIDLDRLAVALDADEDGFIEETDFSTLLGHASFRQQSAYVASALLWRSDSKRSPVLTSNLADQTDWVVFEDTPQKPNCAFTARLNTSEAKFVWVRPGLGDCGRIAEWSSVDRPHTPQVFVHVPQADTSYDVLGDVLSCAIRGMATDTRAISKNANTEAPLERKTILLTGFTDWTDEVLVDYHKSYKDERTGKNITIKSTFIESRSYSNRTGRFLEHYRGLKKHIARAFPNQDVIFESNDLEWGHPLHADRWPQQRHAPTPGLKGTLRFRVGRTEYLLVVYVHDANAFSPKQQRNLLDAYEPDYVLMTGISPDPTAKTMVHLWAGGSSEFSDDRDRYRMLGYRALLKGAEAIANDKANPKQIDNEALYGLVESMRKVRYSL